MWWPHCSYAPCVPDDAEWTLHCFDSSADNNVSNVFHKVIQTVSADMAMDGHMVTLRARLFLNTLRHGRL